jgi:hypothetical protein
MLHELPLWLPIWLYSAFGLAVLAVFQHHHYYHHHPRYWNHSHELIDSELAKQTTIGTMQPASSNVTVKKNAFRMGDFMLHTLPLAVKFWLFDIPATV